MKSMENKAYWEKCKNHSFKSQMCQECNQQKYGEVHELRKRELRHVIFVQSLDIYTLSVVNQAQKNFITNLLHLVPRRV